MKAILLVALALSASLPLQAQSVSSKDLEAAQEQIVRPAVQVDRVAALAQTSYWRRGLIGSVDPDGPRIFVNGLVYRFAPDAEVRLLSGFGAPTLLRPGMGIAFSFRKYGHQEVRDAAGEIFSVVEVPADTIELE